MSNEDLYAHRANLLDMHGDALAQAMFGSARGIWRHIKRIDREIKKMEEKR